MIVGHNSDMTGAQIKKKTFNNLSEEVDESWGEGMTS